jgi:hypothetical protein
LKFRFEWIPAVCFWASPHKLGHSTQAKGGRQAKADAQTKPGVRLTDY